MSLGDLETFISEQEKLAARAEPERDSSSAVGKYGSCLVDSGSRKDSQEPGKTSAMEIHYKIFSFLDLKCSQVSLFLLIFNLLSFV